MFSCKILGSLGILLCLGHFGASTEPNLQDMVNVHVPLGELPPTGCSFKLGTPHCWRYCTGGSKWCYTVFYPPGNTCQNDLDCHFFAPCNRFCAWNSQQGCSRICYPDGLPICEPDEPYWDCQTSFGDGWKNRMPTGGKWISPDIPNEKAMRRGNALQFEGNKVTSTRKSTNIPLTALWYPMDIIQATSDTFYWTFTIRKMGTSVGSSVFIGISDLTKLTPDSVVKGLFYGGNLSHGSGLLIDKFGPTLKPGDKVSILVKTEDNRVKMYVILNDQSLGLAFNVPYNTLEGIYPAVKIHGSAEVEIEEREISEAPEKLEPASLVGTWTLMTPQEEKKPSTGVTMEITDKSERHTEFVYELRFKFVSKLSGNLFTDLTSGWNGEIDKSLLQAAPDEMEVITKMSDHLTGVKNVALDIGNNELRMDSVDLSTVWKQMDRNQKTVTRNPFLHSKN